MNKKLLTPKEYVLLKVVEYPAIFSGSSYDEAAFKVLDHLLNVIGSGVKNHKTLIKELTGIPIEETLAYKYLQNEPLYYGYAHTKELYGGFICPDKSKYEEPLVALESEQTNYPEIKLWILSTSIENKNIPFPNFTENYSTIYRSNFKDLGNEWQEAGIWFYKKAHSFFEQTPEYYSSAFPKNNIDDQYEIINQYKENFKNKSHTQISENYGIPFDGNVEKFATARWETELARIKEFITNTTDILQKNLEHSSKHKIKP